MSIRKRNEDWARRLWTSLAVGTPHALQAVPFEWLRQTKTDLPRHLPRLDRAPHQKGPTDADFMKDVPEDRLLSAAKALLAHPKFDHRDVAAHLPVPRLHQRDRALCLPLTWDKQLG